MNITRPLTRPLTRQLTRPLSGGVSGVSNEIQPTLGLFVGDSTVAPLSGNPGTFESVLAPIEITNGFEIESIADSGDTIAQQKTLWEGYSGKTDLDYVYVRVGLNDMNPAVATATTIAAYQDLVDTIRAGVSGTCKIIAGTMTPAYERWPAIGWTQANAQAKWVALNDAIMGRGETPITGLDASFEGHTAELTKDVSGNAALANIYDSGDRIHPNKRGRQKISEFERAAFQSAGLLYATASTDVPKYIPKVFLWVDAQNTASVLNGASPANASEDVSQWSDISGTGTHYTQASTKPTLETLGATAYRAIRFNGTDDFLQATLPEAHNVGWVSVVFYTTDTGHSIFHDGIVNTRFFYVAQSGSGTSTVFPGGSTVWLNGTQQTFANRGALYTATNGQVSVLTVASTGLMTNWSTAADAFRIGLFNGTPFQFTGDIAEIVVGGAIPSDAHLLAWHNYVLAKYGLA